MIDEVIPNVVETSFLQEIEQLAAEANTTILDAIVHFCSIRNVEIEYIGSLIANDAPMRAKLEVDFENLNFLKKKARLPID